jgi:hypothetical protein
LRTDLAAVSVVPARRSKVPARVIIQAPSHLGLRAAGIEALPEALLAAGFAERSAPAAAPGSLPHPSTRPSTPAPACSTPTGWSTTPWPRVSPRELAGDGQGAG